MHRAARVAGHVRLDAGAGASSGGDAQDSALTTARTASASAGGAPSKTWTAAELEAREGATKARVRAKSEWSREEAQARVELAAAYRLAHEFGWTELVFNHISYRLENQPGETGERFLINPLGLGFDEVTASNLVLINAEGDVLDPGTGTGKVNVAGFVIHSAVHRARPEIKAVMHSHDDYVVAVSIREEGLQPVTQAYFVLGPVTTHDYEGIALTDSERETLARDLGKESRVMVLKNHGALTLGETVGEAFTRHFFLVRAAKHQVLAASSGSKMVIPRVQAQSAAKKDSMAAFKTQSYRRIGDMEFPYLVRWLERKVGGSWRE